MNTQTLNIDLPTELVKRVDKISKKRSRTRSDLMRDALNIYLKRIEDWEEIFEYGRKVVKKMGITSKKQIDDIVYEFRHGRKPD